MSERGWLGGLLRLDGAPWMVVAPDVVGAAFTRGEAAELTRRGVLRYVETDSGVYCLLQPPEGR